MDYEITVQNATPQAVVVVDGDITMAEVGPFIGRAFPQAAAAIAAAGAAPSGPPLARYDMQGDRLLVEAGFPVADVIEVGADSGAQSRVFEGGSVAVTTHLGPFNHIPQAYAALSEWMQANGMVPAGRPWEQYLSGPADPQPTCTVNWPCAPA